MKKMIALLLCLLGSSSLWAQENTVLGTGALSSGTTPKYKIKEINIVNPGSYSRPTIDFGNHQVIFDYLDMGVSNEIWIYGQVRSAVDLTGFVPTIVGGHGSSAAVGLYFNYMDNDGSYIYDLSTENPGVGYSPVITLSPTSNSYYLYSYIGEDSKLIIYYSDGAGVNSYPSNAPPTVNISFGGATAVAVLDGAAVNGQNTAIGYEALYSNANGRENTALGHQALKTSTGNSNIGIGYLAGNTLTTGNNNLFIGNNAGKGITTGSGNLILGGGLNSNLSSSLNNSILMADGSGNPRFLISNNGNMKLGYSNNFTDVGFKLDVNGSIRSATTVQAQTVYIKEISLYHPQSTYYHDFVFFMSSPNDFQLRSVVNPNYYPTVFSVDKPSASMTFYTPVKGVNAVNSNEFVTLGQVRDISSTTDRNLVISNVAPYLELKAAAWSGPAYVQAGVGLSSVGVGNYLSFLNPDGKGFNFKRGAVNDMVINPDGNVGIGITTPQEKLAVNGKIRAREVKVEPNDNWPDYVFEEGYKPMSLAEIATFVKQHKHLPEVPSAKEVAKNGLELGEMNKVLLKKIEELTLHLIEKDQQLTTEKQVNKQQGEEIATLQQQYQALKKLIEKAIK